MLEQGELHEFDVQESWSPDRLPDDSTPEGQDGDEGDESDGAYERLVKQFADFPHESKYWRPASDWT